MLPELAAHEEVQVFPIRVGECLYRDQLGRRVVADVEGPGRYAIEPVDSRLLLFSDEAPTAEFQGAFACSFTVIASGDVEAIGSVRRGPGPPPEAPSITVEGIYEGSGWIVGAPETVEIDDFRTPSAVRRPLPFFRSVRGRGRIEIVQSRTVCRLLDRFSIADAAALKARAWQVQNMSDLFPLSSTFSNGERREGLVASHLNAATWTLRVPNDCRGLLIERLYDPFHGRQRARVLADGRFAGMWYSPIEDRVHRWSVSRFGLELPGECEEVRITIDPPPGTPLWSVAEISVYGLFSAPSTG